MGFLARYDPKWVDQFGAEAERISGILGPAVAAIHHVGSTAIPGILAKPVIDVLVEAASLAAVDGKAPALEALGYEAKGEYGIPGRRYFRKEDGAGVRRYHMHVFKSGSDAAARHLAFRDYLRAHPKVAREYSGLKHRLARQHPMTRNAYQAGKAPFIEATLERALDWWRPPE